MSYARRAAEAEAEADAKFYADAAKARANVDQQGASTEAKAAFAAKWLAITAASEAALAKCRVASDIAEDMADMANRWRFAAETAARAVARGK